MVMWDIIFASKGIWTFNLLTCIFLPGHCLSLHWFSLLWLITLPYLFALIRCACKKRHSSLQLFQLFPASLKQTAIVFKGCHHLGGYLIYWAHVTSLPCEANVHLTNASHTWIDILYTNHKNNCRYKWRFHSGKSLLATSYWIYDTPSQIFFALKL